MSVIVGSGRRTFWHLGSHNRFLCKCRIKFGFNTMIQHTNSITVNLSNDNRVIFGMHRKDS